MITLQLVIVSLIAEMPFIGKTFSVFDVALIGFITIVLRLLCKRLLKVRGLANAISFSLSLVTAAVPMILYMYSHAKSGLDYTTGSNIAIIIVCAITGLVFWKIVNPWYYKTVDKNAVTGNLFPYFEKNVVSLLIYGFIELLPATAFVLYSWYSYAGHFSVKSLGGVVAANIIWMILFVVFIKVSKTNHPGAVIEKSKDMYSDKIEKETETRFEVSLKGKNLVVLETLKIVVLYSAFVVIGLYYDKIHNDGSRVFVNTLGLMIVAVFVLIAIAAYLHDRITLRIIVNKNRFGIHRFLDERAVVDEKNMGSYEELKNKDLSLYYNGKKLIVNRYYTNADKLLSYIQNHTKIEKYSDAMKRLEKYNNKNKFSFFKKKEKSSEKKNKKAAIL